MIRFKNGNMEVLTYFCVMIIKVVTTFNYDYLYIITMKNEKVTLICVSVDVGVCLMCVYCVKCCWDSCKLLLF